MLSYNKINLVYENKLSCEAEVEGFVMEGSAKISFENGRMRMGNVLDASLGQKSNFVYWCDENMPSNVEITWDFHPISEPGLAILFFSALGINGEDIFSPNLLKRDGMYDQYHSSDINAFHVSYFRRMWESERSFHTCNLRKSKGFHLVTQGADPIPDVIDARSPYKIKVVKLDNIVEFYINDLFIFKFIDDGATYGKLLDGGKIGFRQMAPLVAEYANLMVYEIISN